VGGGADPAHRPNGTAANFAQTPHVRAVHGDGTRVMFEPADVIYVNAGATRPADAWLDRLKERGRLILPLTAGGFPNGDVRGGVVFRIERCGLEFLARRISGVAELRFLDMIHGRY
jgi:protein-L-isoaspartate(D-aspartate) O-methyltransferase